MADTAYERITGHPAEVPIPIAVNLVLTDDTLVGGASTPAHVPGYGPVPAAIARRLAGEAVADERSKATLRRLYRHPASGALVAMESRARLFPTALARFIAFRDDTCRTPYCDAPIRHTDHATPHARGGATTAVNGVGTCEACNYAKEAPGWRVHTSKPTAGGTQPNTSRPPAPTTNRTHRRCSMASSSSPPSAVETRIAHHLAGLPAA